MNVGNKRDANYTNLDPGDYTFIVKGANSDGVWSDQVASLKITVTPPFWETWWFRIMGLMLIGVMVLAVLRTRIKIIERQKIMLQELVEQRTSEVTAQKEQIEEQKTLLEAEKEKADSLLLNILPQETVDELQLRGKARARSYRTTTVMFTDFKDFTKIAEGLRPKDLVAKLDKYFIKYDEIIDKHNVEKIKTIGDSYMCAGGIPIRNKSNPIEVVLAGLEIQQFMTSLKERHRPGDDEPWEVRVGIHTGELIAGVVGIKRFAYDIWGDTVNVASRMEGSGEVGAVNISGKTYNHIKNFFDCTYRGKVEAKNKGMVDMYFVDGLKPDLSVDRLGQEPNDVFWDYVNLELYSSINYRKAERYILSRLDTELADDLHYHGIHHTKDVCHAAERIAKGEGIKGEELFLLKTAALYHDAGFVRIYMNNEEYGVELAEHVLPRYGYSQEQIGLVSELIMATRVPQKPTTPLQEIICDADLDYLGRNDFEAIADTLRREFLANKIVNNNREWDELQIKFLEQHTYFTAHSRKHREEKKRGHLEEIKLRYSEGNYADQEVGS